jgi:murein L,D-transpeptidase YafK
MALLAAGGLLAGSTVASALTIELRDAAPDRIERQRMAALGALPLPGTPDLSSLEQRLAAAGIDGGAPLFLRIFKAESELEVWARKGGTFTLFATYPICHWSGSLGPKLVDGDKQNPEGFYEINRRRLHRSARWPQALNLGFPNALDRFHKRTGSHILIHGGCSSIGCFAMTNAVVEEIFGLVERAIKKGQDRVHVHVFPFRMTEENLARYAESEWAPFWRNLKDGYDAFERTRLPPKIGVCQNRYVVREMLGDDAPATNGKPGGRRGSDAEENGEAVCAEGGAAIAEIGGQDTKAEPVREAAAVRRARPQPQPSGSSAVAGEVLQSFRSPERYVGR